MEHCRRSDRATSQLSLRGKGQDWLTLHNKPATPILETETQVSYCSYATMTNPHSSIALERETGGNVGMWTLVSNLEELCKDKDLSGQVPPCEECKFKSCCKFAPILASDCLSTAAFFCLLTVCKRKVVPLRNSLFYWIWSISFMFGWRVLLVTWPPAKCYN